VVEGEFELIGLKGSNRWVETHAVPLLDHGEIVHLAITRDITARKEAEAELREHREHLEKLVENRTVALSLAKEIAEAANRAKSTFLANMSHELRTPMNAIMGMTELVLRNTEDDKQKDQLGKVMQASKHLLAVINDILDISKIEAEHLPLEKTTFNIGSLLENLASIVSQKIQEKGLQLHIEATPEICRQPLLGDPLRLGQVLLNLCTNAIKFTEHGSISVQATISEWSSTDCLIRLQVSDTGLGISEEDQTRIFLAFEQADASTTRQFGGTGLGLAISKRLVQLMGGTIGVTSAPGAGSTFWFTARLPLAAETALAPISTAESSAEEQLLQHYSGRRILLAEDEPINREVSVSLLEECGLLVDIAEDGLQATELARDNAYALILMDMQMPKMGGLEATELIRRQARHAKTPIIAMTANAFEEDRQHCFAAGMNDHIGKPVTPEKLFTTLLKWLGKTDQ
jgi:signal transduction histidine kinase/ActR/RegA family two-component response regulator